MDRFATLVGVLMVTLASAIALGFLLSWPVMMLWNYAIVPATGAHIITWLQAWGMYIFANMVFKSSAHKKN